MILGGSICHEIFMRTNPCGLADVVDYVEPLMLIVGSRGVSQLKGYAHPIF